MPSIEKKSTSKSAAPDDLWTILLNEKEKEKVNSKDSEEIPNQNSFETSYTNEKIILLCGEFNSGKSTLISCVTKSRKKFKPTISLDYDYIHNKKSNTLCNLWEIGGEFLDPNLVEVPITINNIENSSIYIVLDMSKPSNIMPRLKHYFKLIKKSVKDSLGKKISRKVYDKLRDKVFSRYNNNRDFSENATVLRPFNIPITIIAMKSDLLASHLTPDANLILQALRLVSHYYGATLVTGNHNESREVFSKILLGSSEDQIIKELESSKRNAKEKKLLNVFFAGKDSFHDIFEDNLKDSQGRLARDEHDFKEKFLNRDKTKVSSKFFDIIQESLEKVFGKCQEKFDFDGLDEDEDRDREDRGREVKDDEAFSEPQIDEMVALKRTALEKLIKENDRINELLQKQKL